MKILIKVISLLGKIHLPYVNKRFRIRDFYKIERELEDKDFAIGMVSTFGNFSNLMIRFSNLFIFDKRKKKSRLTHVFVWCNGRVIEAIGSGLRETTLLEAIGQRDIVKIRVPSKYVNSQVQSGACKYLEKRLIEDKEKNIKYDVNHNITNHDSLDCSETAYAALEFGYKEADQKPLMETIERFGMETWTPADAEFSKLFETIYES